VDKALLDLWASINLMPLVILKMIGDVEVKSTRMTLQLVDKSIKYLYGVVGDVLIKVDKFTWQVIVDVDEGKLKVRAQDDDVTFNVFGGLKHSNTGKDCLKIDAAKEIHSFAAW